MKGLGVGGAVTYAAVLLRLRIILPEELPLCCFYYSLPLSFYYSLSLTPCFSSSFLFLPSLSLFYSTSFCFSIICFSCSALRLCFNLNCCSFCAVCRLPHLPVATRVTKLVETNSATDWATVSTEEGRGRGTNRGRGTAREQVQPITAQVNFELLPN